MRNIDGRIQRLLLAFFLAVAAGAQDAEARTQHTGRPSISMHDLQFMPSRGSMYTFDQDCLVRVNEGHRLLLSGKEPLFVQAGAIRVEIQGASSSVIEVSASGLTSIYSLTAYKKANPQGVISLQEQAN